VASGVSFGATDAFVNAYAGEGRSGFEAFRSALGTFLGGPLGIPQIRVLNDPNANPWEKAEAASALLSTYALALAGGASIRRSRAPQRTPPGSPQDMIAAKSHPGEYLVADEAMSPRAARYQSQISGRPPGEIYIVDGVKFDGFRDGVLLDAK
jgi:hypothetical protein